MHQGELLQVPQSRRIFTIYRSNSKYPLAKVLNFHVGLSAFNVNGELLRVPIEGFNRFYQIMVSFCGYLD